MKGYKVYHYALSYDDHSSRVYRSITTILHFPIMLALCLMLSLTHYPQTYAGIIARSLLGTYLEGQACEQGVTTESIQSMVSLSSQTLKCTECRKISQ